MIDDRHAWSRPELETVVPGVHRAPLPLPMDALRAVNVYVFESADDLTLIDGGWSLANSRDLLRDMLRTIGADLGDIRRFLVTHVHRDHYTQAVALRAETGARVALGQGEKESIAEVVNGHDPLGPQIRGLRHAGAADIAEDVVRWVAEGEQPAPGTFDEPDDWLVDGQRLDVAGRTLTAVETPGHTRGHLVFTDDSGVDAARTPSKQRSTPVGVPDDGALLFAGDHVLPHITPSIGFEPAAVPGALGRFLTSLATVRAARDRRLLPAHGPVAPSVHARVDELLAHHDRRLAEIEARVVDGLSTAAEIAASLTWTRRENRLTDMETFHQALAVLETDAHLEVLAAQDRVVRRDVPAPDGTFVAHHDPR